MHTFSLRTARNISSRGNQYGVEIWRAVDLFTIGRTSLTGIFPGFKGGFNLKLTCVTPCRRRNVGIRDKYEVDARAETRGETETGHVSRENGTTNAKSSSLSKLRPCVLNISENVLSPRRPSQKFRRHGDDGSFAACCPSVLPGQRYLWSD